MAVPDTFYHLLNEVSCRRPNFVFIKNNIYEYGSYRKKSIGFGRFGRHWIGYRKGSSCGRSNGGDCFQ